MRSKILRAASLALLLAASPAAGATFLTSAADPALSGATVYDLDTETDNLQFQNATVGGAFTLTTTNGNLRFDTQYSAQFGTTGISLETRNMGPTDDFTITFAAPVAAFGFNVAGLDIDWTIEVFDATNTSLGTFTIVNQPSLGLTGNNRRSYAGVSSAVPIAYARIFNPSAHDFALIDNIAIASVPEACTSFLLATGLLGLVASGAPRRGRAAR